RGNQPCGEVLSHWRCGDRRAVDVPVGAAKGFRRRVMIINRPSPFGAAHQTPKRIIVHAMSEWINGMYAPDFLLSVGLSAHALVTPDGDIIKCREDTQGAFHAKGLNTDSLGIEFLLPGHND